MGIRESLLNTITSVGNSDFVRIVTSAGASSKATLQNVIKSFETGLGAKTSLTTSDYIRVVGSDNNLYKQSVSSVQSAWGIDKLTGGLASVFSGDANTLTSTGQWQVGDPVLVQNLPNGANYGIIAVESARSYIYQRYVELASIIVYERRSVDSGTNWSAWTEQPTRAEIDAINSKTKRTTTFVKGNPISVPIAGANDGAALLYGYLQGYNASALILITVVDGTVTITDMTTGTAVTAPVSATVSNGVLTVSTTNQSYSRVTLTSL